MSRSNAQDWNAGFRADLHVTHRKAESFDQDGDAENDKAHKRILEEMGQPAVRLCFVVCVLQFLPGPQGSLSRDARNGKRPYESRMDIARAFNGIRRPSWRSTAKDKKTGQLFLVAGETAKDGVLHDACLPIRPDVAYSGNLTCEDSSILSRLDLAGQPPGVGRY